MNKGSKSNILSTIFLLVAFALLGLGYVSVKLKCESLTKEKVLSEEKLNAVKNARISLTATEQFLASEERIVTIAENELGMVKVSAPERVLTVNKNKIEEVEKALKEKYE